MSGGMSSGSAAKPAAIPKPIPLSPCLSNHILHPGAGPVVDQGVESEWVGGISCGADRLRWGRCLRWSFFERFQNIVWPQFVSIVGNVAMTPPSSAFPCSVFHLPNDGDGAVATSPWMGYAFPESYSNRRRICFFPFFGGGNRQAGIRFAWRYGIGQSTRWKTGRSFPSIGNFGFVDELADWPKPGRGQGLKRVRA